MKEMYTSLKEIAKNYKLYDQGIMETILEAPDKEEIDTLMIEMNPIESHCQVLFPAVHADPISNHYIAPEADIEKNSLNPVVKVIAEHTLNDFVRRCMRPVYVFSNVTFGGGEKKYMILTLNGAVARDVTDMYCIKAAYAADDDYNLVSGCKDPFASIGSAMRKVLITSAINAERLSEVNHITPKKLKRKVTKNTLVEAFDLDVDELAKRSRILIPYETLLITVDKDHPNSEMFPDTFYGEYMYQRGMIMHALELAELRPIVVKPLRTRTDLSAKASFVREDIDDEDEPDDDDEDIRNMPVFNHVFDD